MVHKERITKEGTIVDRFEFKDGSVWEEVRIPDELTRHAKKVAHLHSKDHPKAVGLLLNVSNINTEIEKRTKKP